MNTINDMKKCRLYLSRIIHYKYVLYVFKGQVLVYSPMVNNVPHMHALEIMATKGSQVLVIPEFIALGLDITLF